MIGIYLLLGTNLPDKQKNLESAIDEILKLPAQIEARTGIYESPPWGFEHPESFYNQLIRVSSKLEPHQLLQEIKHIEYKAGRVRKPAGREYEARLIDIDILYFGDRIIQTPELTIPHPRLHQRRFALVPLCDLAPSLVHPVLQKTQTELLEECTDDAEVKIIP